MKRIIIIFLFTGMSLTALLFGVSCSNQTPNSALVAPLTTVSAINPTLTFTFTPTFTVTPTPTPIYPIGGFNGPYALAIDSSNNIYVGDTGNNLIKQFVSGVQNTNWPIGKAKTVNGLSYTSPKAIAIDSTGNLYVVGSGSAISKYAPNGNFLIQYTNTMVSPTGLSGPLGLAVNSGSTTLYVSDSGNQRILAVSLSTGTFSTFESLSYIPQGLAINNGDLYVASASGAPSTIYNYELSSGLAGSPATIPGFNSPYDLAFDSNNNLYVSDTYNSKVEEFTAGHYSITPSFIGVGTLSSPEGIVLDSSGNVYVIDSGNSELFQFP